MKVFSINQYFSSYTQNDKFLKSVSMKTEIVIKIKWLTRFSDEAIELSAKI